MEEFTSGENLRNGIHKETKAAPEFSRSGAAISYCAKIIAARAVAFVLVAFFAHLPAARGPGRDRLNQEHHPAAAAAPVAAAAAAAAGVVVAEAADHTRPAFFLVGVVLHPLALPHPGARAADVIRQADLREVGPVQRRP